MEENKKSEVIAIDVKIDTEFIKLDSFLKFCGEAATGSDAKDIILDGKIEINGEVCVARGKKLYPGDILKVSDKVYRVVKA